MFYYHPSFLNFILILNNILFVITAIEERIQNIEVHLDLMRDSVPSDIYSRIKEAENRLLFLESISPEYPSYSKNKVSIFLILSIIFYYN